jgi:cold shock CspA family protein
MLKIFRFSSEARRALNLSGQSPVRISFQLIMTFSNIQSPANASSFPTSKENQQYLQGEIISFSVQKGLGFIKPLPKGNEKKESKRKTKNDKETEQKKEENLFFTKRELSNAGVHKTLWSYLSGVQVRYSLVNNRITSLLGSTGLQIQPLPPPKRTFPPDAVRYTGTIKFHNSIKGYGAITVANIPADIIFYEEDLYLYGSYQMQGIVTIDFLLILFPLIVSHAFSYFFKLLFIVNTEVEFSLNPEALKQKKYEAVNVTGIGGLPVQRRITENSNKGDDVSEENHIIEEPRKDQITETEGEENPQVTPTLSSPSINSPDDISTTQEPIRNELSSSHPVNPFPFRQTFNLSIPRYRGIIRYFSEQKGYGFIMIPSLSSSVAASSETEGNPNTERVNDIFVYYKDIYYQGPESILSKSSLLLVCLLIF